MLLVVFSLKLHLICLVNSKKIIPGIAIKFDKIYGENENFIEGGFSYIKPPIVIALKEP